MQTTFELSDDDNDHDANVFNEKNVTAIASHRQREGIQYHGILVILI